jgi:8-oxo-dGTP pyrophosphatase MutT (NUDIX family)
VTEADALAQQYGAIPWHRDSLLGLRVLLITSRISRKWLIPKGWLVPGLSAAGSACREAYEEAGVEGPAAADALGAYDYLKIAADGREIPCRVTVFAMKVQRLCETWPEAEQRTRQWFALEEAAARVSEPGLRELLASLSPEHLTGEGPAG